MAIEIEAKIRLDDRRALEEALADSGAVLVRDILEIDTYLDTPEAALRTSDQGLRVRVERDMGGSRQVAVATHKGPIEPGPLKQRSETQVEVNDAREMIRLFEALGYVACLEFEKHRRQWELDGCDVVVDVVPYLGQFVEIEGPSAQAVYAVRDRLGLASSQLIRTGYASMLREYLDEHQIDSDYVPLKPPDD